MPGAGCTKKPFFMKLFNCFYPTPLLTIAVLFFTISMADAQQREALTKPRTEKSALLPSPIVSPFTLAADRAEHNAIVEGASYLQLDATKLQSALKSKPRELVFRIDRKSVV